MIPIRNKTPVSSYELQIKKYLPELQKIFQEKQKVYVQDAIGATEYSKFHTWKLMIILQEMGWIQSSLKDKQNRKFWTLTDYGIKILEENYQ
jgi:hypothetical protein